MAWKTSPAACSWMIRLEVFVCAWSEVIVNVSPKLEGHFASRPHPRPRPRDSCVHRNLSHSPLHTSLLSLMISHTLISDTCAYLDLCLFRSSWLYSFHTITLYVYPATEHNPLKKSGSVSFVWFESIWWSKLCYLMAWNTFIHMK